MASFCRQALIGELIRRDKRSETIQRQLLGLSKFNMEKLLLDQMDMRHSKSRDLTLQGFKIASEKCCKALTDLEQQYAEAEPTTIIGLTDNSGMGALALFGRNELARKDEYVL